MFLEIRKAIQSLEKKIYLQLSRMQKGKAWDMYGLSLELLQWDGSSLLVHPLTVCTGGLLTQSSCRLQGLVLGKMAQ
jgi:hypothetical protein